MKKVQFNAQCGQLAATLAGKKTQFHNVETRLVRQLDRDFTSQKVVNSQWIEARQILVVQLDNGEQVEYKPDYAIDEVVAIEGADNLCSIRITGMRVERLCNPTMDDLWAEGFIDLWIDGCKYYAYLIEENKLTLNRKLTMPFISSQLAWNNLLYRTLDPMMVVCNPYSVVYQFELIKNV